MRGRVQIIDGDVFFSPNSERNVKNLPFAFDKTSLTTHGATSIEAFDEPHWWTASTEWLGFVPKRPVCYNGPLLEVLAFTPRHIPLKENNVFIMQEKISAQWLVVDRLLWEVAHLLGKENGLSYVTPFPPCKWGYQHGHVSEQAARYNILQGRDWFAMWIGLIFWMTRKVPEDPKFEEAITPPRWFMQLVKWRSDQILWDQFRTAPLLQRFWNVERVGLLLHFPDDYPDQPHVAWFIGEGVPVWYRWGNREIARAGREGLKFKLIPPPPELLQEATTWISPTPASNSTQDLTNDDFCGPSDVTPSFDFVVPQDHSSAITPPSSSPPKKRARTNIILPSKSGRAVWEPWLKKREAACAKRRARETPLERQRRENRERCPPTESAPVYVWDWDFDDPTKFVRTLVRRDERKETLDDYGKEQKRYDPYFNEWNCCREWGEYPEDSDESSDEEMPDFRASSPVPEERTVSPMSTAPPVMSTTSPACSQPSAAQKGLQPFEFAATSYAGLAERAKWEVLEILTNFYGFVRPASELATAGTVGLGDIRSVIAALGITSVKPDNMFWKTSLGRLCVEFGLCLAAKEEKKPHPSTWDLSMSSGRQLRFARRLKFIRKVKSGEQLLYMFDLRDQATVPWCIAVYTASAALFICRLDDELTEKDIVMELASAGIPFRTLQKRASLQPKQDQLACSVVPMRLQGHVFTRKDFDSWEKHCHAILCSKRARAALLRGGFVWRLALRHIGISEALKGPSGVYPQSGCNFVACDVNGVEYLDDDLTNDELDVLCGLYKSFTGVGKNVLKSSWYPLVSTFEASGENNGRWSPHLEELYKKRSKSILNDAVENNLRVPISATKWRDKLRGFTEGRRAAKIVEAWSTTFLNQNMPATS